MKLRNQKGPFHYTYIGRVKNEKEYKTCSYYYNNKCLKDNSECMYDSYCVNYTQEKIAEIEELKKSTLTKCPVCGINYINSINDRCDMCINKNHIIKR